uniref:F-box/LRR-repeat protein n=1 Tax=Panagrellus redivivus TaxID=6233 RepID=A0A7E4V7Q5_PANRE
MSYLFERFTNSLSELRDSVSPSEAVSPVPSTSESHSDDTLSSDYQQVVDTDIVNIDVKTRKCADKFSPIVIDLSQDVLYRVNAGLSIVNSEEENDISPLLDHFLLNPNELIISNCHVTPYFLQSIASRLQKEILWFKLEQCTVTPEVSLESICTTFQSVNRFWFKQFSFGNDWVKSLLKVGKTGMLLFEMKNVSIDVLDIDKNDFLKFFKAQNERFVLQITYNKGTVPEWRKRTDDLLKDNFVVCNTTAMVMSSRLISIQCSKCSFQRQHRACKATYILKSGIRYK